VRPPQALHQQAAGQGDVIPASPDPFAGPSIEGYGASSVVR